MGIIHFLNVNEGDCAWIEHPSNHNTVIDISNGNPINTVYESMLGDFNQKNYPVNPIKYLKDRNVMSIFRFILSHPDMDHMDGFKSLFENFEIVNFWDTANTKEMLGNSNWGKYNKEDWDYYQKIRKNTKSPKVLNLYVGSEGKYYNENEDGTSGADGLYILAPTISLVSESNKAKDYNDCSYVILYKTGNNKKVIFAGDSAQKTWDYILKYHKEYVSDVDLLLAPHHGRKTGGNRDYLDVLKPKLTIFGNAKSEYLNYDAWNNRNLDHITNNQANCIIVNTDGEHGMDIYVTYEIFAKKRNPHTYYDENFKGWYILTI